MKTRLFSLVGLVALALTVLACAAAGSVPTPTLIPPPATPTPPPIPTRVPPTPPPTTVAPEQELVATLPAGEKAAIVYGSIRGGQISLFFLSSTHYFAAPLNLGSDVAHAVWPDVSPDGTRVAFVSVQGSAAMRSKGIYVAAIDGSRAEQITFGDGTHPRWSPDGTQVAYTCNDGTDVCVINADGSGEVNLTASSPAIDQYPDWTHDGRIVFMSARDVGEGRLSEIYVMDADGANVTRLTESGQAYNAYPRVSPNGKWIAFESDAEVEIGSEVYLMDIDGQNVRRLTFDEVWNQNPVWSPDSTQVMVAASDKNGNIDLYAIPADGGDPTRLTENPSEDGGFRLGHTWLPAPIPVTGLAREGQFPLPREVPTGSSPVTNAIVFATNDFNCDDCLETGIYLVSFDGANLARLPLEGFYPAFDPDFRRIAYTLDGELVVANVDGSSPTQITAAFMGFGAVAWDARGLNIVADCTPFSQFDVCTVDTSRGTVRNVTEPITADTGLPLPTWRGETIIVGSQIIDLDGHVIGNLATAGRLSPDGTRLAAIVEGQLTIMALDGSYPFALTDDEAAKGFPVWSPSGDMLVYTVAPGDGRLYLHAIRADGTNPYRLVEQPIASGPTDLTEPVTTFYGYNWAP